MEKFEDIIASVLDVMRRENRIYNNYVSQNAMEKGNQFVQVMQEAEDEVMESILELFEQNLPYEQPYMAVWWYSVLIGTKNNEHIFHRFLQYIQSNRMAFSANTQYFLWYQLMHQMFLVKTLDTQENKILLWQFYNDIIDEFAKNINTPLSAIPKEDRDENFVLVITEQFLVAQHGPTKTALDRCKALISRQKRCLLVNDAEVLSTVGMIPYYAIYAGNNNPSMLLQKMQSWKGVTIPYYQCEGNMPDLDVLDELLSDVRKMAPGRVILIGKGGVFGNLVSRMVPTLTIGLCPSALEYTTAKYQTLGRKINSEDIEQLQRIGLTKNHVIECCFTSSLLSQTQHTTREQLGLSEEKFLLVVVGARLDLEVSDDFLMMLEKTFTDNMFLAFCGIYEQYEKKIHKYPKLKLQSANLGYCDDILSILEVCDLYVNPMRRGGGTSSVEALFMGIPVVTVSFGDVSTNVGEEFCVQDYQEMQDKIMQYNEDKAYYEQMSKKAKARADILLDTETEFIRVLQEMDRRETEIG